jgi:hypothetical protein
MIYCELYKLILFKFLDNSSIIRRVWRYQRGNQNPYIVEEQIIQWPKEKVQTDKQRYTKYTYKIIQTTHKTTIKQTYAIHIIYTVNNTTLYTLQQQGQRKPQIQLQIIPFYTYFIIIIIMIIIIIVEAVAMTLDWLNK